VADGEARDWREVAQDAFLRKGIATFSPFHAFRANTLELGPKQCEAIIRINDMAVASADAILANLGGKSFGTPLECQLAWQERVPIVAFGCSPASIYRHRMRHAPDVGMGVQIVCQILSNQLDK
jgi:hypothetical protein